MTIYGLALQNTGLLPDSSCFNQKGVHREQLMQCILPPSVEEATHCQPFDFPNVKTGTRTEMT